LQGIALQFIKGREFLTNDACPYAVLREHLIGRFSEKMPAQYHYTRLQDAIQEKGESVEEFADRCRKLCQKTVRIVEDGATQRVINEEAERRLVAAYINGLGGMVGRHIRYRMLQTLEEAVQIAVTVNNAEQSRAQDTKVFSARRDSTSQGITCYNCGKKGHYARD
jgi:DNA-binding MurR/RpiR family transcriptional regulator